MADSTISNLPASTGVDPTNDVLPIVHTSTTQKVSPQDIVDAAFPQVPFTPTGGLSATTVNAAIVELDTEKDSITSVNAKLALKADASALPTAMDSATAQAGTSTTAQTVSASVLDGAVQYGAFTPAGTGAVSRTVQSKLKETVSVKDFGAVGDGVTDDTAAIQAALNVAYNIYFPTGTYLCKNINVASNKYLFSYGDATIKLPVLIGNDVSPIFNVIGSNVTFSNLNFNGNAILQPWINFSDSWNTGGNGTGKSIRSGIFMDSVTVGNILANLQVIFCKFTNFYCSSIATRDVDYINVDSCSFYDTWLEAVFAYASGTRRNIGISATNNNITNLGIPASVSNPYPVNGNGIVASSYDKVIVNRNKIIYFERNLVKLESCNYVIVDSNHIESNTLIGFNSLQAQVLGTDIIFSNNIFKNVQRGILIDSLQAGLNFNIVKIINNIFDGIGTGGGGLVEDAIDVSHTKDFLISGNSILNCKRYPIYFYNESTDGIISNNKISNTTNSGYSGIVVSNSNTSNIIIKNNFINNSQSTNEGSIWVAGTSAGTISNLIITENIIKTGGAANGRAIWSNSGIIFSNCVISNNIFEAEKIEFYPAAGSTVVVQNNIGNPRIIGINCFGGSLLPASSAIPSSGGPYYVGDIAYNSSPAPSGVSGWVCTTAGSPGTWKSFGAISA